MKNKLYKTLLIHKNESVKDALKKMDRAIEKALIVVNGNGRLVGTITDGDIRRYILKGKSLDNTIEEVYNGNPIYLEKRSFSASKAEEILQNRAKLIPIVDDDKRVVDCVSRNYALFKKDVFKIHEAKLRVPVVIMAGGKGTRLEPLSKIFPKPLIPVGDKPIAERIIDEFKKYGIGEFYITLNYKGEMIESYFNHIKKDYKIRYIREKEFLGTAGSLRLLANDIADTFIVSNCDVIVKANFKEVVKFHKDRKAALTVLSSIQHYKIPYGVINFRDGGNVIAIHEKPEYTLTVNTGAYVLDKKTLRFIPKGKRFDMTDLIHHLIRSGRNVVTYPVNENDYIDIGQWDEYKKAIGKI